MKSKRRGRPRAFDEERARRAILDSFWERGYSAVSLDDLSQATGMGRPSLYSAFGNKEQMYLVALDQFRQMLASGLRQLLDDGDLLSFFLGALRVYESRGCFVVCTASVEVTSSAAISAAVRHTLEQLDRALTEHFQKTSPAEQAQARAYQAAAWLHSLAVRSRAGQSQESLQQMARLAADSLK